MLEALSTSGHRPRSHRPGERPAGHGDTVWLRGGGAGDFLKAKWEVFFGSGLRSLKMAGCTTRLNVCCVCIVDELVKILKEKVFVNWLCQMGRPKRDDLGSANRFVFSSQSAATASS